MVEEIYSNTTYTYNFSKELNIDWREIFKGQKKLKDIVDPNQIKQVKEMFEIFFENKHIEISLNKIANYIDYLGKI